MWNKISQIMGEFLPWGEGGEEGWNQWICEGRRVCCMREEEPEVREEMGGARVKEEEIGMREEIRGKGRRS